MSELFWLNDTQWAAIAPLLPDLGGKPRVDDRRVLSGILHRFREGLRWRALPDAYGPRTTVFNRSTAGASAAIGRRSLQPSSPAPIRRRSPWWTAPRCEPTAQPQV